MATPSRPFQSAFEVLPHPLVELLECGYQKVCGRQTRIAAQGWFRKRDACHPGCLCRKHPRDGVLKSHARGGPDAELSRSREVHARIRLSPWLVLRRVQHGKTVPNIQRIDYGFDEPLRRGRRHGKRPASLVSELHGLQRAGKWTTMVADQIGHHTEESRCDMID